MVFCTAASQSVRRLLAGVRIAPRVSEGGTICGTSTGSSTDGQDKLYIKHYDAETNLDLHLLIDWSGSMTTASAGMSKQRYAGCLGLRRSPISR